jgi:hypothetical protein
MSQDLAKKGVPSESGRDVFSIGPDVIEFFRGLGGDVLMGFQVFFRGA